MTAAVGLSDETVTFTGDLGKAAVTITGVNGNADDIFNVDGATMGTATFSVGADAILQGTAAKLSGVTATGVGTTAITALDDTVTANLGNIATTTVTAAVGLSDETVTFTGDLGKAAVTITGVNGNADDIFNVDGATMGTATFSVGADAILQGTAAKLSGVTATGVGTTAITALDDTVTANLGNIATTTVTAAVGLSDETVTFTGDLGKAAVTITGVNGNADDIFNVDGATMGTATFSVGADAILQGTAAKLSGVTATGVGTTAITALDDTVTANLGNIATTTVTAAVGLSDETVTFTGDLGKAAVTITGVNGNADDIFNVDGATMGTATFSVGADAILQGTAAKLSGVTATGVGTTAITALDDTVTANLGNIATTTVTAAVGLSDETVTFTGDLGKAAVTITGVNGNADDIFNVDGATMGTATFSVGADAILQGTAAKLSGVTATGVGTTAITALDDTVTANLGNIATTTVTAAVGLSDETVTFTGDLGKAAVTITGVNGNADDIFNVDGATMGTATFSVGADAILQGTAAKLTGVTATGLGATAITALHSTLAADLSGIDTTTTTAAFDGDGTFTGTLDGAVVTVGDGFHDDCGSERCRGRDDQQNQHWCTGSDCWYGGRGR